MCNPLGFEQLGTHRAWRDLADRIAAQGRPTLRFDYDGVNDSLGSEVCPDRINTWVTNVKQAVDFLRSTCHVEEVALVGLRFGATLASLAAAQIDGVEELVLMAPVVTGRTYVRELRLVADAWWSAASPMSRKEHNNEHLDVIGDRIYKGTLDTINKIDLRKIKEPLAKRVLVLDPGARPEIQKLVETFNDLQLDVTHSLYEGNDEFLRDSVLTVTPEDAFAKITDFLSDHGNIAGKNSPPQLKACFACNDFRETAIRFGPGQALFGILTEPVDPSNKYPTVMLLNTGPNLHVGNGRLSVILSRHLALWGITSLRFDLAGIGESEPVAGRSSGLYTLDALADVKQALDVLEPKSNGHGTIAVGLCSGAFLALHAAIDDRQITGSIIVNLQRFVWKEGTSLQVAGKRTKRSTRFYVRALGRRQTWVRIFKGEGDIVSTVSTLSLRFLRKIRGSNGAAEAGTPHDHIRKAIKRVAEGGTYLRFWYSEDDPGLSELEEYFGKDGRQLASLPNVKIETLPGADHSLNSYAARMQFIAMVEAFLREGFNSEPVVTPI
jgi:pimeloyl-ACP methyl ester carboxylesterase